jgi:arylsulfatase A-like enzyme
MAFSKMQRRLMSKLRHRDRWFEFVLITAFSWLACLTSSPVLLGAESPASIETADTERPNVVVFLSDDQGWGDFSINGNQNLSTPNIDGLAAGGASFDRFYVCPVCSPTRAEFLTGRYYPRGGVYSTSAGGERLNTDVKTIADAFRSAGYATAAFGKWHNGMQYPYHPCGRGFDLFYGFCSGHWGNYFDPIVEQNGRLVKGDGFLVDDCTERAMQFMDKSVSEDKPFFVYLPYNTPHSPMQVPEQFYKPFANAKLIDRATQPEKEDLAHTRAALAMCENIDWNVGRVLKKLDAMALSDNTIVVYFCDNGPNGDRFNGGMKGRKGSTDEGGVRSPLFVRWPKRIAAKTKVAPISSAVDIMPTLMEMAGIDSNPTKPLDGMSLQPLLIPDSNKAKQEAWPDRILFSYWNKKLSVRNQRFRLDHKGKLFDMVNDPKQTTPVNDSHAEVAAELSMAGKKWLEDVNPIDRDAPPERPFPVGHPDFSVTQLPARDAVTTGNIKRSNKYPNCSYFSNWTSTDDMIQWPVEVIQEGEFKVTLYYACKETDIGCEFELGLNEHKLPFQIVDAHEVVDQGAEHDRVPRVESFVKDFKPVTVGSIRLDQGFGNLTLKANVIPGDSAIEFRLLLLERK